MFQSVLYGKRHTPKEFNDAKKRQKKYNSYRAADNEAKKFKEAQKFRLPFINTGCSYPKIALFPSWAIWDKRIDGYENESKVTPSKPIVAVTEGNFIACVY